MSLRAPLIGLLVAVLVSLAFFFLLYKPRSAEQAALQDETVQLQAQQASLRAEIADLERVRGNEPRMREILARLNQLIPPEVAQPQVLEEFQALSDAAAIDLFTVTFADPVAAAPPAAAPDGRQLAVVTTTVALEGTYYQAVDFLRRVEQEGPRAVVFDSVSLAEGEDQFPTLAVTLSARLFALVPPEAVAVAVPGAAPAAAAPAAQPSASEVPSAGGSS